MFRVLQHHFPASALAEFLTDGLMCFLAVLLALATMSLLPVTPVPSVAGGMSHVFLPAMAFTVVMSLNYVFVGLYKQRADMMSQSAQVTRALVAIVLGAPVAYLFISRSFGDSINAYAMTGLAVIYLSLGVLLVRSAAFSAARTSVGAHRVLVVGTGVEAQRVAADLRARARGDHVVVGFYPTGAEGEAGVSRPGEFSRETPIEEIVAYHQVDEIIVAVKEQRGGNVPMEQLLACRISGVPVVDLAAFYERTRGEVPIDSLKASFLVYGHGFVQDRLRTMMKRAFDIVSSSILLIVASPVMLLTALAVRLESSGPIIYSQERVGLGGRVFMCLKFRSMRTDAEKDGVARWASKNDSRVTRVGALIRKTRIDELPQLISVLRGEMSMVGPRPERPAFVGQLKEQIPYYDIRHSVKPGVTGWAQVRYSYGASIEDARRKHQFDLYYVKNNSLLLDLLILVETISVVLFREGAQ